MDRYICRPAEICEHRLVKTEIQVDDEVSDQLQAVHYSNLLQPNSEPAAGAGSAKHYLPDTDIRGRHGFQ